MDIIVEIFAFCVNIHILLILSAFHGNINFPWILSAFHGYIYTLWILSEFFVYYPHFVDTIGIGCIMSYIACNVFHVLYGFVMVADIISVLL